MKVHGVRSASLRAASERLRCVIIESGSLPLAEAGSEGYDETIVIAQMQGELPAEFAARVSERLAVLERVGKDFESKVLLIGNRHDQEASGSRREIIAGLSRRDRARCGTSELTLMIDHDSGADQRAELLALAEAAMALPNAELMPIRLRFGHAQAA